MLVAVDLVILPLPWYFVDPNHDVPLARLEDLYVFTGSDWRLLASAMRDWMRGQF